VSIGTLVAFTALQGALFRPMVSLLRTGVDMQTSMAMFRRVFDYLDLPVEIDEPVKPRPLPGGAGELTFKDVSFAYPGSESQTLTNINLTVAPGTHVAVVGSTGSGKTTLGYLSARLYDPTGGSVTLDGIDIRELGLQDLASVVGIVSQEAYLLHASIADNLRFAKPDATLDELRQAARAAQIDGLIDSLPDGYDTLVSDGGGSISAGEKQLITIARAFLARPQLLILDEATSSVDTRTELLIQQAMGELRRDRTSFIIAHRLSTIRDADLILVMEAGRIVEQGTHDELLARRGAYWAMTLA